MALIKVYGHPYSTAAMRVFACLHEKELEFKLVQIDIRAGEHKREPFISLNPFGQVPVFEDGDLKIFESRAVTRYIAHEYAGKGSQLMCLDTKKMAIQSVWVEVEAHQFDPVASKLTHELAIKPLLGIAADKTVVEEYEAKLAKVLDVYEARLAQSKYLAGDCFTLADMHHLPTLSFLLGTPVKNMFESRPHVNAWVADITARPAWSMVLAMQKK